MGHSQALVLNKLHRVLCTLFESLVAFSSTLQQLFFFPENVSHHFYTMSSFRVCKTAGQTATTTNHTVFVCASCNMKKVYSYNRGILTDICIMKVLSIYGLQNSLVLLQCGQHEWNEGVWVYVPQLYRKNIRKLLYMEYCLNIHGVLIACT